MLKLKGQVRKTITNDIQAAFNGSPNLKAAGSVTLVVEKGSDRQYLVDEKNKKLVFISPDITTQNTMWATYIIVSDYVLRTPANFASWNKHWKANKRVMQKFIMANKQGITKLKKDIGGLKVEVLGLAVMAHVYVEYTYKNLDKGSEKVFKDTFLNFFKRDVQTPQSNDSKKQQLFNATSTINKFNALPEKGVSTNLDAYLPSGLKIDAELFEGNKNIAAVIERLEQDSNLGSEDQILQLAEEMTSSLVENFMIEVLGKEHEVNGKKVKPKNFKAQEWQAEQRQFLDALANTFNTSEGEAIINDLDPIVKKGETLPLASRLPREQKKIWEDIIEKTNSEDIKDLFKAFVPKKKDGKVKSGAYDWYSAAADKLEDFKLLIDRASKLPNSPYSSIELQELLESAKSSLQPEPLPNPDTPVITIGPIKGASRAIQKIEKYNQDVSRLGDIVRFTVVVDQDLGNFNEVFDSLVAQITAQGGEIATRIENRYDEATPTGYGDVAFSVRYPSGVVGEVQITTPTMAAAKNRLHIEYEKQRNVDAVTGDLENMSKSVQKLIVNGLGDAVISTLEKAIQESYDKQVGEAKDNHKAQMQALFDANMQPILDEIKKVKNGELTSTDLANFVSKKANSFNSKEELYEYEQMCVKQLQGYVEARESMGLPDFVQPFPFRVVLKAGSLEWAPDFYKHIEEKLLKEDNYTPKVLAETVERILLSRSYDKDTYEYPASYTKEVEMAFQKKSFLVRKANSPDGSGFYMIEGIPYEWRGFGTLPKFFTGDDPKGTKETDLAEFLQKATPISEDLFHKTVAELTMEKVQRREDLIELGHEIVSEYKNLKNSGQIKTARNMDKALRNKLVRLAHSKPHLRKHILPLLK